MTRALLVATQLDGVGLSVTRRIDVFDDGDDDNNVDADADDDGW